MTKPSTAAETAAAQDLTELTDHQLLNLLSPVQQEWERRHPRLVLDVRTPGKRYTGMGPDENGQFKVWDSEEAEHRLVTSSFAEAMRLLADLSEASGADADRLSA